MPTEPLTPEVTWAYPTVAIDSATINLMCYEVAQVGARAQRKALHLSVTADMVTAHEQRSALGHHRRQQVP